MAEIKRIWQVVQNEPIHTIKEDRYIWEFPEDLEELINPDSVFSEVTPKGYKVLITSFYHSIDTVIYFCIKCNKEV